MTARAWCFTINGKEEELDFFELELKHPIRYAVWQFETGEQGTLHIQGYVELAQAHRMAKVKKILGFNAHVEKRLGTREQARDYCMKEEGRVAGPFEIGEWVKGGQGKRCDLADIYQKIISGADDIALLDAHPGTVIRNHRGISWARFSLQARDSKSRRRFLKVIVYYGDAGTGKTRAAYDGYEPNIYCLSKGNGSNIWFDGYNGESCLLLDDFYGWIPYGFLLQLLDIYPLRLEVKGGHTWAAWTTVIITSNKPWDCWYERGGQPALDRRIHAIYKFDEGGGRTTEREEEQKEEEGRELQEG